MRAAPDERRRLIVELLLLLAGGSAATAVFTWTDLDLMTSRVFFDPQAAGGPWPAAGQIPWSALHHVTPWLAAGLGFLGLGLLVRGMLSPERRRVRLDGLVIVLSLALGPGLVVNAIFKDHWKRPRPRQTVTLGGDHAYVPPLRMGPAGKSFPCGHCSVGFAYGALYYVLRRRRPAAARLWLAASVVGGLVLGFGRVASGGHFASDVVFAAILTYGTTAMVHYPILRVQSRAAAWAESLTSVPALPSGAARGRRLPRLARAGLVLAAGCLLVFLVLMATPFEQSLGRSFAPGGVPGGSWHLVVRVGAGHARIILESGGALIGSAGSYDGFGFPGAALEESLRIHERERHLLYDVEPRGWFADLEGQVTLTVAAPAVASMEIEVADGILTLESRLGDRAPPDLSCRIRPDALRLRGGLRRDQVRILTPPARPPH